MRVQQEYKEIDILKKKNHMCNVITVVSAHITYSKKVKTGHSLLKVHNNDI